MDAHCSVSLFDRSWGATEFIVSVCDNGLIPKLEVWHLRDIIPTADGAGMSAAARLNGTAMQSLFLTLERHCGGSRRAGV